jgi:hypothetical protein
MLVCSSRRRRKQERERYRNRMRVCYFCVDLLWGGVIIVSFYYLVGQKAAETIKDLISENDELCRQLDSNSMHKDSNKDKVTWNALFFDVKDYFAKVNNR